MVITHLLLPFYHHLHSLVNKGPITALLFLLFAIPVFLFLREPVRRVAPFGFTSIARAIREVRQTVERTKAYPGIGRFLIGRALYADAANTTIVFMGIYVTNELGFSTSQAQLVLLAGILGAVAGGFAWGLAVDHIGPKRTLNLVLTLWMVTLGVIIAIPVCHLPRLLFWGVAVIAGVALGGTWAADRPYMLRLSPPEYLGQFYGLYAMVGRFAAIIGPLLWGLIVNTLGWGRPTAVGSLALLMMVSFLILQPVSDTPAPGSGDHRTDGATGTVGAASCIAG